jgi:hypothetical protein
MAREALMLMGYEAHMIEDYIQQFRKRDRERLLAQIDAGPEAGRELMYRRYRRVEDEDKT